MSWKPHFLFSNHACLLLLGLRIPLDSLRDPKSDNDQALALRFGQNVIDIYACPWGPPDHGWGIWPVMPKTELSVKDTIAKVKSNVYPIVQD